MNLDPELVNSVRVLCALEGNPYFPTGRECVACGGNDDINEAIQGREYPPSFCAEETITGCRDNGRKLIRDFADTCAYRGIDLTGATIAA